METIKNKLLSLINSTEQKTIISVNELTEVHALYLYNRYMHLLESKKKKKAKSIASNFVLTAIILHSIILLSVLIF